MSSDFVIAHLHSFDFRVMVNLIFFYLGDANKNQGNFRNFSRKGPILIEFWSDFDLISLDNMVTF